MRIDRLYRLALLPILLLLSIESNSGTYGAAVESRSSSFAKLLWQDQEAPSQLDEAEYLLSKDAIYAPVDSFQFSYHGPGGVLFTSGSSFCLFHLKLQTAQEIGTYTGTYLKILFSSLILINAP